MLEREPFTYSVGHSFSADASFLECFSIDLFTFKNSLELDGILEFLANLLSVPLGPFSAGLHCLILNTRVSFGDDA